MLEKQFRDDSDATYGEFKEAMDILLLDNSFGENYKTVTSAFTGEESIKFYSYSDDPRAVAWREVSRELNARIEEALPGLSPFKRTQVRFALGHIWCGSYDPREVSK